MGQILSKTLAQKNLHKKERVGAAGGVSQGRPSVQAPVLKKKIAHLVEGTEI
jgi:hypothetical protein